MNFSKSLLPLFCLFIIFCACKSNNEEKKEQKSIDKHEGIEKIKNKHREIDSINSLKKKRPKRSDSLKPSMATLEFSTN